MLNFAANSIGDFETETLPEAPWAVITGGSGFIGTELSVALLEVGYQVLNLDSRGVGLDHAKVKNLKCEITDLDSIKYSLQEGIPYNGAVGALIHCAFIDNKFVEGVIPNLYDLFVDPNQMVREFEVGIIGALLVTQEAQRLMKPHAFGSPSIVFLGSDLSVISPDQRIYINDRLEQSFIKNISYTVSKHAIIGLVKHLATLYAPLGIRVNCISPGPIKNNHPEFLERELKSRTPLNRLLKLEELKGPLQFLVTEKSSFITGQNLLVDGGRTIW